MITLNLPWPPTLNSYYRNVKGTTLISAKGRLYRGTVRARVIRQLGPGFQPITGRLHVSVYFTPPDKRKRDIDNHFKAVFDALTKAGVWGDDSQVKSLSAVMLPPEKGGRCTITIEPMEADQ